MYPLEIVQRRLLEVAERRPDDLRLQLAVAESYLFRADLLRGARRVQPLDRATHRTYRTRQAEWGAAGLPQAERTLKLFETLSENAQAERVLGELYVHQISGPFSGLTMGPKALRHIQTAMEYAPQDPECNRAIGLMYLNNPPINGGDLAAALRTFRFCTEQRPGDDRYQFQLALTFRKLEKPLRAQLAARKALQHNPKNTLAAALLSDLKKQRMEENQ